MRRVGWFLLAFLFAVPIAAQDGGATCAEYNPPINIIAIPPQTNDQFHITGYHYYNSQAGVNALIPIHRRTPTNTAPRKCR
jgi:hypothetical protein